MAKRCFIVISPFFYLKKPSLSGASVLVNSEYRSLVISLCSTHNIFPVIVNPLVTDGCCEKFHRVITH